ncbi:hypothetical protein [Xenophilus azovorans]|uniref:hypothetical protein n=1 Tax=Xenophilus azovorans TaxID=151755 RepID=UPI0009FBAA0D|nr:hypothetical protein [Xenophilus azovorans]
MSQLNYLIEKGKSMFGSYGALADAIGVPNTHISMWKSGRRYCSPPDRAALASAVDEDPTAATIEAVIEGIDLKSPQGKRATHALQVALHNLQTSLKS